jgi:Zn-dependent metalloprotease
MRHRRRLIPGATVIAVALCLGAGSIVSAGQPATSSRVTVAGYRALSGEAAKTFRLPGDVRLVRTWRDGATALTFERYQQFLTGAAGRGAGAFIDGGQLTVVRRAGSIALVIGAYYPSVATSNRVVLDPAQAVGRALADRNVMESGAKSAAPAAESPSVQNRSELRLDPATGRFFYLVESGASGLYVVHQVDAETGAIIDAWDALDHESGMGTGVKGDRKSLRGDTADAADDLTSQSGGIWRMQSADGRLLTLDARRGPDYNSGIPVVSDNTKRGWRNDNDWAAAYEHAAVDAQYYLAQTDDFYRDPLNVGGFDLVATCGFGQIRGVVHYDELPDDGFGYDNAFWDGYSYHVVFGDGDGQTSGPFSGGQDVVAHELTHAVTQCRAPLSYSGQPGALNEAFSDIMATTMEWQFNEATTSGCRREPDQAACPDWWVGEDVLAGDSRIGFRNLADPALGEQPGHYDDRFTGWFDNRGVHLNSTIPSHAFYLMVNGGRNARCAGPIDPMADCDVLVPQISLHDGARIAFTAWGLLTNNANFCEARNATVAAADLLFPGSRDHHAAADLSWAAVGRSDVACNIDADFSIQVGQRSAAVLPGGETQMNVALTRGTQAGPIDFAVEGAAPATLTLNPSTSPGVQPADGTVIGIQAPADMPDGVYPLIITATDGSATHFASAVLVVDGTAPAASISDVRLAITGSISATGDVPLRVTWAAHDPASGVVDAALEASTDGATYTELTSPASHSGTETVIAGAPSYWFRVTATDAVGNATVPSASGPWMIGQFQESSATYYGAWSAMPSSQTWGSVRYATRRGAAATFDFTGTDVAWISSRGPTYGKAKIYLDGSLITTLDLHAATSTPRRICFAVTGLAAGSHTIAVAVAGTRGRPRVDMDGFVVLSQ